jgi:uncharacterized membrane protein YfcA
VTSFEFGIFLMAALVMAIAAHRISTRRREARKWEDDEPRVLPAPLTWNEGGAKSAEPEPTVEEPWIVMEGPGVPHADRVVGLVGLVFTVGFGAIFLAIAMYVGGSAMAHLMYRLIHSST